MDDIVATFSDIQQDKSGSEYLRLYFERPCKVHFFDFLETRIPGFEVVASEGFTDQEIQKLLIYAMKDSSIVWETAKEIQHAKNS